MMSMFSGDFTKGTFYPKNIDKCLNYNGKLPGVKPVTYRSSWELKVCNFCDRKENVLEWGSEVITLPYINENDNKKHNYTPDFKITIRDRKGNIITYICEVKPASQSEKFDEMGVLIMPKAPKRMTQKSVAKWQERCDVVRMNHSKWVFAREMCKKEGYTFKILTEKELGIM